MDKGEGGVIEGTLGEGTKHSVLVDSYVTSYNVSTDPTSVVGEKMKTGRTKDEHR